MEKFTPQEAIEYIYASGHTEGLPGKEEALAMLPDINSFFKIGVRQRICWHICAIANQVSRRKRYRR